MATPFQPLDEGSRLFHIEGMLGSGDIVDIFSPTYPKPIQINFQFPISGILPSGEANFYDPAQDPKDVSYTGYRYVYSTPRGDFPFFGFIFASGNSSLSASGINSDYYDSTIQSKYIHYTSNPNGGTGEDEDIPFEVSFDPNEVIKRYIPTVPTTAPPTTTPEPQ